jgi:hypothetical protein
LDKLNSSIQIIIEFSSRQEKLALASHHSSGVGNLYPISRLLRSRR